MKINQTLTPQDLLPKLNNLWELSAAKIHAIQTEYDHSKGSPVFTIKGKYTTRGWTEWTQGFEFGSEILQYDATGDEHFLKSGRDNTVKLMAPHVSHFGVHDHGFNNVSTYGNLLRLMNEGRLPENEWERNFYELALKLSGAAQARRWTPIASGEGYIYSFNGPQSLFADTIRSLRALAVGYQLGHPLMEENDRAISLLERLVQHARTTAKFTIFYGEGRDAFDIRGRTAHESLFNVNDGNYRAPNSQQGFSPFTTWTRGLAWCIAGYPEELEFLKTLSDEELAPFGGREEIEGFMLNAAKAVSDFYIQHTSLDGIPYWDTGAPNLHKLGDYTQRAADPYNEHESVDSSAAVIAAQGLIRLGRYLGDEGKDYTQAGLTVLNTVFDEPYLSTDANHHGLILHSNYHLPNGWDHIPPGRKVACDESCMWGDYHAREAALLVQRLAKDEPYLKFFL
ncbi:MAG: glycosyl hydrolase [Verrucomicrobia bacterium]|nr:glycosyl hydrolase [Verrucomicrobiota bacterium]MCH8526467.1 glycosyl hydrolase [Kiritimatiellia bacterium]